MYRTAVFGILIGYIIFSYPNSGYASDIIERDSDEGQRVGESGFLIITEQIMENLRYPYQIFNPIRLQLDTQIELNIFYSDVYKNLHDSFFNTNERFGSFSKKIKSLGEGQEEDIKNFLWYMCMAENSISRQMENWSDEDIDGKLREYISYLRSPNSPEFREGYGTQYGLLSSFFYNIGGYEHPRVLNNKKYIYPLVMPEDVVHGYQKLFYNNPEMAYFGFDFCPIRNGSNRFIPAIRPLVLGTKITGEFPPHTMVSVRRELSEEMIKGFPSKIQQTLPDLSSAPIEFFTSLQNLPWNQDTEMHLFTENLVPYTDYYSEEKSIHVKVFGNKIKIEKTLLITPENNEINFFLAERRFLLNHPIWILVSIMLEGTPQYSSVILCLPLTNSQTKNFQEEIFLNDPENLLLLTTNYFEQVDFLSPFSEPVFTAPSHLL